MFAKMIPAKRLPNKGSKGSTTYKLEDSPVSYFTLSMQDVLDHLSAEGSLDLAPETEDTKKQMDVAGLPVFVHQLTNWLQDAVNAAAKVKARGGFSVAGDTPETLKLVLGDVPQTLEELLATSSQGGPYMVQKQAFVSGFKEWATTSLKRPLQFIKYLSRSTLEDTPEKAIPHISNAIEQYVDSLGMSDEEVQAAYGVYLAAAARQLGAEQEEEDWDSDDYALPQDEAEAA